MNIWISVVVCSGFQTTQNSLRDRVDFLEKLMGESADKHSQAWFDSTSIASDLLKMDKNGVSLTI